jgi:hypothetical protein
MTIYYTLKNFTTMRFTMLWDSGRRDPCTDPENGKSIFMFTTTCLISKEKMRPL